MPVDASLTTDRDIALDPTGDIALESGRDNIRQQHANALFRAAEHVDAQIQGPDLEADLEAAVRSELGSLDYVQRIARLDVEAVDRRTLSVTVVTDAVDDPVSTEVTA